MIQEFYSNGKLLLTGEYLILDGAVGLAVPTKYGQFLTVTPIDYPNFIWESKDEVGKIWFELVLDINTLKKNPEQICFSFSSPEKNKIADTLLKIMVQAKKMNPEFLKSKAGYKVTTELTFKKEWGLGSSSTLLNNVAQWANINPYQLLWNTLGGSGYDIACAQNNTPILYNLTQKEPKVENIIFEPSFKDQLYFIHLNKKQNSQTGILNYRLLHFDKTQIIKQISEITLALVNCKSANEFASLINTHELILSKVLGQMTIKELLFPDYNGSIKSLGAWGGDFILAIGDEKTPAYFKAKDFMTVIPYTNMVL